MTKRGLKARAPCAKCGNAMPMLLFGLALHARNIIRPDAHDENAG